MIDASGRFVASNGTQRMSMQPSFASHTAVHEIIMERTQDFIPGTHATIDKVSDTARPAVDRLASGAHQAVDKIAGAAGQVVETFGAKGEQLNDAQQRLVEAGRNYVRDNPMMALGIAIAAGFVLSRVLSSR